MLQSEAEMVVNRKASQYLHKRAVTNGLILRVDTGLANSCLLYIQFNNGRLMSARIRGEDGPHEVFIDAPSDIVEKQ